MDKLINCNGSRDTFLTFRRKEPPKMWRSTLYKQKRLRIKKSEDKLLVSIFVLGQKKLFDTENFSSAKHGSSVSESWSRSSSRSRSKVEDMEGESEFQLASNGMENKEENADKQSVISNKETPVLTPKKKIPTKKVPSSGIPLPLPSKTNKMKTVRTGPPARVTPSAQSRNSITSRHTLEVQFLNKTKRLAQIKNELIEKQKPAIELYQSLLQIKKKLGELGKCVKLEDVKFVNFGDLNKSDEDGSTNDLLEGGDALNNVKKSIEQIPKTLTDVCRNLLNRRAAIVELLETISKTDVDSASLQDKVSSLKSEGTELRKSLDTIIGDHEKKIQDLVGTWQKLIRKQSDEESSGKVEELENRVQLQENLLAESKATIAELHKRLDEKRSSQDKVVADLESLIKKQEEKIKKLENDMESEKKLNSEHKNRNATSVQTIKSLKSRIAELENRNRDSELKNSELSKKLMHTQDQIRLKESIWSKEKEDLSKNLKHQESLVHKLTLDRNHFETRYKSSEETGTSKEKKLLDKLDHANTLLDRAKDEVEILKREKEELMQKCNGMQDFLKKMTETSKETMDVITNKVDWGKTTSCSEAELLSEVLSLKVEIRNYEDKVKVLEEDVQRLNYKNAALQHELNESKTSRAARSDDPMNKYQLLLEESEKKLSDKCRQVHDLQTEIRHLKVRQNAIDEQNDSCPTSELMKMVNEGKAKMTDLIRKSMENDQKLHEYEMMVEKQQKQMNEMENLLKMRNGLLGVMKSKKDELQMEKESLTRYSNEMRSLLFGIKEDLTQKSDQIQDLTEKLEIKERTCTRLEKKIADLEENLAHTNQQRFKLQDTIGTMEKELQSTKAHIHQMADLQTRSRLKFIKPF